MTASLKFPMQRSTGKEIQRAARDWIGTPFQHQQSLKGAGVDCVGLILGVGRELGVLDISPAAWAPFAAYSRSPNPGRMRRAMRRFLIEDKRELFDIPSPGSIGWFGWRDGLPMHLAIVGRFEGRATMIHAFAQLGKCVENSIDATWLNRVDSWWQFPGRKG